jgi:alanine racemase
MSRPTKAVIDLGRLTHNLKTIRNRVGEGVQVCPAVKADAYGHGAVEVSTRLVRDGADMLAVASIGEAAELREAGIQAPILVLGALLEEEAKEVVRLDVRPIITDLQFAEALGRVAGGSGRVPVHVKIDTGMGRLGFPADEAVATIKTLAAVEGVLIEGLLTHFPSSDERDKSFTHGQIETFKGIISALEEEGIEVPIIHAANSGAIIDVGQSYFNMVRPGIMLYGLMPSKEVLSTIDIKPILKITSRIVHVKRVPAGRPLSYGRTFVTKRESSIGVVPMGYADGYNRLLSNRASVQVAGKPAPVAGRVCMDQFLIDITDIPAAGKGSEVTVYSDDGGDENSVENIAALLGTIPNEVVCAISKRIPRSYIG